MLKIQVLMKEDDVKKADKLYKDAEDAKNHREEELRQMEEDFRNKTANADADFDDLNKQLEALKKQIKEKEQEKEALNKQLGDTEAEREKLAVDNKNLETMKEKVEEQFKNSTEINEVLEQEVKTQKEEVENQKNSTW